MTELEQQRAFHSKNRKKLQKNHDLIIISGNSFMQSSNDLAFPFEQDSHFYYLTGVTEPEVILIIDRDEEYLIIPDRDASRTAFEGAIDVQAIKQVSGIDNIKLAPEAWEGLSKRLSKVDTVATLEAPAPYIEHYEMFTNPTRARLIEKIRQINQNIEIVDLRPEITSMRMIKSSFEMKMISKAIKESFKLFKSTQKILSKSNHETDLAAEVAKIATKNQLKFAYEPIIASGRNALTLHYVKNNDPLDKSGVLLLDMGLKYNGYAADITRSVSLNPTNRQQEVFDAVLSVHTYAMSVLRPGITIPEYEAKVNEFMAEQLMRLGLINDSSKESIRKYYPHATSHFLGIDVHDVADYSRALEPGMVLTVEPGIYIPEENIGIRLEDDVLITKNGVKNLSSALPKRLDSLTIGT